MEIVPRPALICGKDARPSAPAVTSACPPSGPSTTTRASRSGTALVEGTRGSMASTRKLVGVPASLVTGRVTAGSSPPHEATNAPKETTSQEARRIAESYVASGAALLSSFVHGWLTAAGKV